MLTDESVRWIISRGRPYFSASGEPERVMGVSMDITERKQSNEALQKAYHEIKQLKDQLEAENIYLRQEVSRESDFEHIIGTSGVLMKVLHQVEQVAATDSTVLLSGETGTGKELIAQAVHNLSPRHGRLMVKVNCAALPAALIESELFGRESALIPEHWPDRSGALSWLTVPPCSLMRSRSCRLTCRQSCCGCWRMGSSSGSAARRPSASMCG